MMDESCASCKYLIRLEYDMRGLKNVEKPRCGWCCFALKDGSPYQFVQEIKSPEQEMCEYYTRKETDVENEG